MAERIRVRIEAASHIDDCFGWASFVDDDEQGYTIEWDSGPADEERVRWFFEGDGIFNLEEVTE